MARSLAFAIPGGIAAQETGFVLACGLFGIPPRRQALAMSLLKRLRELVVGVAGVLLLAMAGSAALVAMKVGLR